MRFEFRLSFVVKMAFGRNVGEQMRHIGEARGVGANSAKEWDLFVSRVGCTGTRRNSRGHLLHIPLLATSVGITEIGLV